MATSVTEPAPAKVNLYLHVLGRRPDGYHELQSLVAFADIGDSVTAAAAPAWSLALDGPFAGRLSSHAAEDNLVLRAARRLMGHQARAAALTLTKNLPVAAGIGGGSADAAAALRALARLYATDPGPPSAWADLGGDIPVCLFNRPALVEGMGERLRPAPDLPPLPAVLVNPGEPSATRAVFQGLGGRFGPPHPAPLPSPAEARDPASLARWLAGARNDLTRPAIETAASIAEVLAALSSVPGALLARMSGSGATCFALFATAAEAGAAALWLAERSPNWWIRATVLGGGTRKA